MFKQYFNISDAPKSNNKKTAALTRREMLNKWKAEKELKKKLEAQQKHKKPTFKISHAPRDILGFAKPMVMLSKVVCVVVSLSHFDLTFMGKFGLDSFTNACIVLTSRIFPSAANLLLVEQKPGASPLVPP